MPAITRVVQIDPAPMPTLTASTPRAISASVAFRGRDVAGDEIDVGKAAPEDAHHVQHALAMPVRGVDDEGVDAGRDERLGAIDRVAGDAHRGAASQPAQRILGRERILDRLLNVLDGDQSLEAEIPIDDEQLFDFVLVQNLARGVERGADRDRDQVLVRHDLRNRPVDVGLESQIAVRQDADQPALFAAVDGDRHAPDRGTSSSARALRRCGASAQRDRITIMPLSDRFTDRLPTPARQSTGSCE